MKFLINVVLLWMDEWDLGVFYFNVFFIIFVWFIFLIYLFFYMKDLYFFYVNDYYRIKNENKNKYISWLNWNVYRNRFKI